MSKPKAITNKGIIIFKDYELLFNFLTDEEAGKVLKKLLENFDNGKLKKCKNFENEKIKNVYMYISNRINDYLEKSQKARENGALGGNPTLNTTLKGTDNGRDKGEDNLKEDKIKEEKVKRIKEEKEKELEKTCIEILDFLNLKTGYKYKHTETNLKLIKSRLNDFTKEELENMINYKVNEWINDDKMRQYLRPQTLFGASKCENYVVMSKAATQQKEKSDTDKTVEFMEKLKIESDKRLNDV